MRFFSSLSKGSSLTKLLVLVATICSVLIIKNSPQIRARLNEKRPSGTNLKVADNLSYLDSLIRCINLTIKLQTDQARDL